MLVPFEIEDRRDMAELIRRDVQPDFALNGLG
jgi:hypothetical protein